MCMWNQTPKKLYYRKGHSLGHNVIDLKSHLVGYMYAKVSICYSSNGIQIKLTTDGQLRQDKNRSEGINIAQKNHDKQTLPYCNSSDKHVGTLNENHKYPRQV